MIVASKWKGKKYENVVQSQEKSSLCFNNKLIDVIASKLKTAIKGKQHTRLVCFQGASTINSTRLTHKMYGNLLAC